MIIPIRCFSCGKVLADKYEKFVAESKKLEVDDGIQKRKGFENVTKGVILDQLGCTKICCRRIMLSSIDLMDQI